MTLATLTALFGWMTVLNFAMMLFTMAILLVARDWATGFQARLFGLPQDEVNRVFYTWLGNYKLLTLVFALIPYLALRIVA
ncbi:hypothetical protein LCL97_12555 [Seohaeicola saemankumensis]|nr:hypothetical protein [Seohaeicola saemankumensis]MCA0871661.1 hypothetical protein [Seohaeicola saemankumensis]